MANEPLFSALKELDSVDLGVSPLNETDSMVEDWLYSDWSNTDIIGRRPSLEQPIWKIQHSPGHDSTSSGVSDMSVSVGSPESAVTASSNSESEPNLGQQVLSLDDLVDENSNIDLFNYLMGSEDAENASGQASSSSPPQQSEALDEDDLDLLIRRTGITVEDKPATPAMVTTTVVTRGQRARNAGKMAAPEPKVVTAKAAKSTGRGKRPADIKKLEMELEGDSSRKNAIQAKINREKKKMYIQNLEEQVNELSTENKTLKEDSASLRQEREDLAEEVRYLKSVLANQSALAGLLKNIGNVESVSFSTSFLSNKRSLNSEMDHDYGKAAKRPCTSESRDTGNHGNDPQGGVCLHVHKDNVSLEFCAKCSSMAGGTRGDS